MDDLTKKILESQVGKDLDGVKEIYKIINSNYIKFFDWAYMRDTPYWENLLSDWKVYISFEEKSNVVQKEHYVHRPQEKIVPNSMELGWGC